MKHLPRKRFKPGPKGKMKFSTSSRVPVLGEGKKERSGSPMNKKGGVSGDSRKSSKKKEQQRRGKE